MAIYHLSVKTISRSAGRSVTAAAAYRASEKIVDARTGQIHDYTHKKGVLSADIILPKNAPEWAKEREALWNAAEQSETRKNSTVGREFEIALPNELNESQRRQLAIALAEEIVSRHNCVADVAIHEPGKGGDSRNHHAHVLCSTRRLGQNGFHEKTRELDEVKRGEVVRWRERFAVIQNQHLREAGHIEHVDHRSLEDQGIDRIPTVHLGPAATNYERRTGKSSYRRQELEQEVYDRLRRASLQGEFERQLSQLERSIIDVSTDLEAALREQAERKKMEAEKPPGIKERLAELRRNVGLGEELDLSSLRSASDHRHEEEKKKRKKEKKIRAVRKIEKKID
jgi:ATP-dependent exoDNAse (exonuclease V) alpha subunit